MPVSPDMGIRFQMDHDVIFYLIFKSEGNPLRAIHHHISITFRADEGLIRKARERAQARGTTLDDEFRNWLEKYALVPETAEDFTELMDRFAYVRPGRSFRRDEMNES